MLKFDSVSLCVFSFFSDIVDGNLKSIMRLILALAAHFKPQSVKHSTQANNKSSRSSVTGIAQVSFRKPVVLWVQSKDQFTFTLPDRYRKERDSSN
jgi:hypothetical protein